MLNTLPTCPTPAATTNTDAFDYLTPLLHECASRKQNMFVISSVLSLSPSISLSISHRPNTWWRGCTSYLAVCFLFILFGWLCPNSLFLTVRYIYQDILVLGW
jgi:hypothetical protein